MYIIQNALGEYLEDFNVDGAFWTTDRSKAFKVLSSELEEYKKMFKFCKFIKI